MKNLYKIIISSVISYLFIFVAYPLSAQEYEFKLHHLLSAQSPAHKQMLEPWARQVEANSNGMVKIEIFPSMSLGGRPAELVSQARDGVVDLVWTVNGYTPGLFPRTEVMELPTVFVNDPSPSLTPSVTNTLFIGCWNLSSTTNSNTPLRSVCQRFKVNFQSM